VALHFWPTHTPKGRDGAASSRPLLTLKNLKVKEIEMELTRAYGNEALQISAVKNGERLSYRGQQSSETAHDREGLQF
jgi:hypothetical protein